MLKNSAKTYLEQKAADLAEPVRKLIAEGMVLFGEETANSSRVYESVTYNNAKFAIVLWVKAVLAVYMAEFCGSDGLCVKLCFPDSDTEVEVEVSDRCTNIESSFGGDIFPFREIESYKLMKTPIGTMNLFIYEAITQIKGNPAELFYCYISSMLKKMHGYKGCEGVLSNECLKRNGIQDFYKIYKLDFLLRDIDKFFNGQ